MQDGNGLQYLLTDHLDSVVGVADTNGELIPGSTQRYLPFGAERMQASPADRLQLHRTAQPGLHRLDGLQRPLV